MVRALRLLRIAGSILMNSAVSGVKSGVRWYQPLLVS